MAKSQGTLILITMLIGALFFLSGLVFTLQGLGIVGPSNGFMFRSSTWIDNGVGILVVGIVLLGLAFYFRTRSKSSTKAPADQQATPDDQKTQQP